MNRHHVESSNIISVGWEDGVLEVEFKRGEVYQYQGVPEWLYHDMIYSRSIGKFHAQYIVGKYEEQRA